MSNHERNPHNQIRNPNEIRSPKPKVLDHKRPRPAPKAFGARVSSFGFRASFGFRISDFGFRDSAFPWHLRSATLVVNLFMQSLRNHFLPRAANFGSRVSDFFRISSRLAGGFRIFLWLALFSTPVLAQPANDNFNMAQDLGFPPAGSDFGALLGVYTGNTVSNQALIGEGYSLVSFGADLPVMFTAVAGTTYNITVDGYFFGVLEGDIVLSWFTNASTAFAAGDFRFTSDLYLVSESESFGPIAGRMHVAGETAPLGPGARLTVTRVQGDKGRVLAGYQVTNTFYTNLYTTNIYGTNVFT